ncbi:hypothetical protein L7F22_068853 [Adiantum nelumboides]|nr:hypothetical protein [Adiantum nelumboides]
MRQEILSWEIGIQKLPNQIDLLDLQGGGLQKGLREELKELIRAKEGKKITVTHPGGQGQMGSTMAKDRYHSRWVTKSDSETGTGIDESNQSRWRMNTSRSSKRKEREEWHRSRSPYRKDRGPDLKIACPIFKGKKHDDPNVHIQAFEQHAELKHILKEEWGEYFPHTFKEAARKWYYHYPASKLQSYKKLKKAFVLEYTDDQGDEDILCELDKIKQGKLSVKKYVQKLKELTRRLNESTS